MPRLPASVLFGLLVLGAIETCLAADWPTYGRDNRRSAATGEQLSLPLSEAWAHRATPPRPAWPEPARQDFWNRKNPLTPSITFDRAHHVAVAGGNVFFGSTADDKITCLNADTGGVRWTFFTEGPVRLAPTVDREKVYAGSDDGYLYCLNADDGTLLWKYRVAPDEGRIPGNGRMISRWPLRTGVLIDRETAYVGAGLFPTHGVYLAAVDINTGEPRWRHQLDNISPQGYLLASSTRLFVPSGRNAPALFDLQDGKPLGMLHGVMRGGSFALLCDETLAYRSESEGTLAVTDVRNKERLVVFNGQQMVVCGETAFVHSASELAALDRPKYLQLARERNRAAARKGALQKQIKALGKQPDEAELKRLGEQLATVVEELNELARAMEACWIWKQPCAYPHALILAGELLLAGGEGEIAAFDTTDGKIVFQAKVDGRAYGLAVADGRLYVSTDRGVIHCFK